MANLTCPKCNCDMNTRVEDDFEIDECPKCGGIWVDNVEEKLRAAHQNRQGV